MPCIRWLKTTQIYSFAVLEVRILKSGCSHSHTSSSGSRGPFLSSSSFWRLQASLGLWLHNSHFCPVFTVPYTFSVIFFSISLASFSLNLGLAWMMQSDLESLVSSNTLFPNKVTFTGSGDQDVNISLWGRGWHHSIHEIPFSYFPLLSPRSVYSAATLTFPFADHRHFKHNRSSREIRSLTAHFNCCQLIFQLLKL